jgi:hypothetical protein
MDTNQVLLIINTVFSAITPIIIVFLKTMKTSSCRVTTHNDHNGDNYQTGTTNNRSPNPAPSPPPPRPQQNNQDNLEQVVPYVDEINNQN